MRVPYSISDRTFSAFIDGRSYQTDRSNPRFDEIRTLLADPDATEAQLVDLMSPIGAIVDSFTGSTAVAIVDNEVVINGQVIHSSLTQRLLDVVREGLPSDGFVAFVQNVFANPADFSREELYLWLEKADLPITPDGCFLAYKIVKHDYRDIFSGKFDNSVGQTVVLPGGRAAVHTDRSHTCARGLHFCSKGYLPHYGVGEGSHVMLVKINPADVVSIPNDCDSAKGRTWRYEVIGEVPRDQIQHLSWAAYAPEAVDEIEWDSQEGDDDDAAADTEPFVLTVAHGKVTRSQLDAALAATGGVASYARSLGIPASTVQTWKSKLGLTAR